MRPYGMMIVKNEASRYLESVLSWHQPHMPVWFIVDDGSSDNTKDVCYQFTDQVITRPDDVPSFLEDEAAFRQWAWLQAGRHLELNDGDWLFSLDADEFYVPREGLESVCANAESIGAAAVRFRMPEIWEADGSELFMRTDGYWNRNKNIRLVKYVRGAQFRTGKMGGGSVPKSYEKYATVLDSNDSILHFGYMQPSDRYEKFERYNANKNVHSSTHIESIPIRPTLQSWTGVCPSWWLGQSAWL